MPKRALTQQERKLHPSAHGGTLRNRRRGRRKRTLSTHFVMHLIPRPVWALGVFSLATSENRRLVNRILNKHATRTGVGLIKTGNAGDHIHLIVRLPGRSGYCKFIRSVAGEIAYHLKPLHEALSGVKLKRYWRYRPFSSIVAGHKYLQNALNYMDINRLEGHGYSREFARFVLRTLKFLNAKPP
jgi:REP element-mobilizing transposase RayT